MNATNVPLVHAIRGPVTLITVGVLFALNNFTPYEFEKTWPALLIVFGLLSLARRALSPAQPSAGPAYPPPPQYGYPPPAGGYRQSPYAQPQRPETRPDAPPKTETGEPPSSGGSI